jgi:hypothetical protein
MIATFPHVEDHPKFAEQWGSISMIDWSYPSRFEISSVLLSQPPKIVKFSFLVGIEMLTFL